MSKLLAVVSSLMTFSSCGLVGLAFMGDAIQLIPGATVLLFAGLLFALLSILIDEEVKDGHDHTR